MSGTRSRRWRWLVLGWGAVWVACQVLSRRMSAGDEYSDEFRIVAIWGGRTLRSRASGLRTGTVSATMGGAEIDLTGARLDPFGATLAVRATMGGVQVTVPPEWAVDVDQRVRAGGVDTRVTPAEELPDGAPRLRVEIAVLFGGVQVTTPQAG